MEDILKISETIIIDRHRGGMPYKGKKYTQICLMGVAHILFSDIISLLQKESTRSAEMLLRPLLEIYVNFHWIDVGPGLRNYKLFIAEDAKKAATIARYTARFYERAGLQKDEVNAWLKIEKEWQRAAKDAYKSSKFLSPSKKCPSIMEKVEEIANSGADNDTGFEEMMRHEINSKHRIVHTSYSHLERLTDENGEINLQGTVKEHEYTAFRALILYLAILTDYANKFNIKVDLERYWEAAPYSRW
jgi:hypothetical protein